MPNENKLFGVRLFLTLMSLLKQDSGKTWTYKELEAELGVGYVTIKRHFKMIREFFPGKLRERRERSELNRFGMKRFWID